ncbi:potassium channel family protein [Paenibacillus kandeliae]|uniref:potassium channel family protein n=1 Tax=Paenibacillus kandeliae TaxID=3231269 RepID=UPI00345A672D
MISFLLTLKRLIQALLKVGKEPLFRSLIITLLFILLSGTIFYRSTEGWSILDAFYFSFVSLIPTSVDTNLSPHSNLAKYFTMIYLVVGTGVMLIILIRLGLAAVDFERSELQRPENHREDKK